METLLLYNTIILIFSAIAFFCNLGSLIYIIKTFDIKQSFFHIFCMDALIVMGSTFISFVMSALSISGQNLKEFSCSVLFFGFSITVLTSPMTFQMISIIRYVESQFFCKSLKAKNWSFVGTRNLLILPTDGTPTSNLSKHRPWPWLHFYSMASPSPLSILTLS